MRYLKLAAVISFISLSISASSRADYKYAVVVSEKTYADASWKKVADALQKKHKARIIRYQQDVEEVQEALKDYFPRYACFVARPEEADRDFVIAVHQLNRKLQRQNHRTAANVHCLQK